MSWLLDTCVVSEPTQKHPNAQVLAWLEAQHEDALFISVLTLGEIRRGAERLPAGRKRQALEQWLARDLPQRFQGRILMIDTPVALRWGQMLVFAGRPLPAIDSLIAATCLAHDLTLVSRNTQDLADTGVELLDPWATQA